MRNYDVYGRLAAMEIFSHEATYPPSEYPPAEGRPVGAAMGGASCVAGAMRGEARSGLSTNPRESTRTGIRENPCPSVANTSPRFYTHDGNKNVSEAVAADAATNEAVEVVAHYDYAAFGAVVAQKGDCAEANPWRFSSEYEDVDLGLGYYNYRHYEPVTGRWLTRDPIGEVSSVNLYSFCRSALDATDWIGLADSCDRVGNFNILSMDISLTPQERAFNQSEVMKDAERLLEELAKFGFDASAKIGKVNWLLGLILKNGISFGREKGLNVDAIEKALEDRIKNGIYRVEGILSYQLCKCVNGKLQYERQPDLTEEAGVDFSGAYDADLYREAIYKALQEVEKSLLSQLAQKASGA